MVTQNEISALFITKQSLCHTGWPKNEVSDLYDVWYFQRGLDDPEQSWLFRENLAPRINNRGEGWQFFLLSIANKVCPRCF